MLTETELYVGGLAATMVSALGSIFNISTLYVLLGTKSIRSNPTTVLIIFLTISNLVYTGLVLPQTAASMLHIRYMFGFLIILFISDVCSYYERNPVLCQLYSFFFFWSFLALLLIQVALAFNRWTIVCSSRFHFTARTSLVSGCLCWLLALLVLLLPLITTGSSHFGWDQQLGQSA